MDAAAMIGIPRLPGIERIWAARHFDDGPDRQSVSLGKFEIPFIVRRYAHHRAVAVAHEHIVAHPHRHRLPGDGMPDRESRRHSLLFLRREFRFDGGTALAFLDERRERRVPARRESRERML